MNGGIGDCAMVLPGVLSYIDDESDVRYHLVCRDKVTVNFVNSFFNYINFENKNIDVITVNFFLWNLFRYIRARNLYFLHSSHKKRYIFMVCLFKGSNVFIKEHYALFKKWANTFSVYTHYRSLALEMLRVEPFIFCFPTVRKENYVLIYPNSGNMFIEKRVPARIFKRIIKDVHLNSKIYISGHVEEKQNLEIFRNELGLPSVSIVCSDSFLFTFDLIRKAAHIYTSDNALSHIASLFDEWVTTIYGPTDPRLTGIFSANGEIVDLRNDLFDVELNSWKKI